jgi:hypothetical protein
VKGSGCFGVSEWQLITVCLCPNLHPHQTPTHQDITLRKLEETVRAYEAGQAEQVCDVWCVVLFILISMDGGVDGCWEGHTRLS